MSHFLTFVTDGNGVVIDPFMRDEIIATMAPAFGFSDVFVYSHGWWTDATDAAQSYNRFSIGLVSAIRTAPPGALLNVPAAALAAALHWPSKASDDRGITGMANLFEPLTFYAMEKRADDVGETGVYALLRQVIDQRQNPPAPLRIHLLGHSFGCKVVCAALAQLGKTCGRPNTLLDNVQFNLVLLQAAFDNDDFDPGQLYGTIPAAVPNLRVLVTTSQRDAALGSAYPLARKLKFFSGHILTPAMGFEGPTANTQALFGGCYQPPVAPGDDYRTAAPFGRRLVWADLTALHDAQGGYGGPSGHHSDIYLNEIYDLIVRFLF